MSNDTARLALTQWIRSASQRNVDALVKVGDYYYHGYGVSDESETVRWEKAAKFYQSAADTQLSALAMWNLGWMYENGMGVPQVSQQADLSMVYQSRIHLLQDFHLAKRHYDQAMDINTEAYLPVTLSLIKLYAKSLWHTFQGGGNGLDIWGYDEDKSRFMMGFGAAVLTPSLVSVSERANMNREIDPASRSQPTAENGQQRSHGPDESVDSFEDDGPWYLGKAREEFQRRKQQTIRRREEEDDPVQVCCICLFYQHSGITLLPQWARERRNAENERDSDFGPEDYFDAALRGGRRGEENLDEFLEMTLLVGLCLVVAVLIYIRTRFVERIRREQEERNLGQPRPDLGLFPPPDDPARQDWQIVR